MQPHWGPIARALLDFINFNCAAWENQGNPRRIGSNQDPFGHVSAVLLFLPTAHRGDSTRFPSTTN